MFYMRDGIQSLSQPKPAFCLIWLRGKDPYRRYRVYFIANHNRQCNSYIENNLQQAFDLSTPNEVWVGDIMQHSRCVLCQSETRGTIQT